MRLSIVIPVLNSHEIVRRQLLHWILLDPPKGVELILIDDGSEPPLERYVGTYVDPPDGSPMTWLRIYPTNDFNSWTQPKARNIGAKLAQGEFLLMTDIDHILVRKTIDWALEFPYDYGRFKREFGVLDENGVFTQDIPTLQRYGFDTNRLKVRGLRLPCHTQSMVIRRSVFEATGGYPEGNGTYPTHDDGHMKGRLGRLSRTMKISRCPDSPENDQRETIYMFPCGRFCGDVDYNPFGLFHTLTRKGHGATRVEG